jgi:predicted dienelactone hydrolase
MRILEVLVLIALLPVLISFFFTRKSRPGWLRIFPWLALLLVLLHLAIEKYRWQMVPAYLLTLLVCLLALRKAPTETIRTAWWRTTGRIAGAVLGLLVCALTVALAAGIPVFQDPATTGPYAVGTTRFFFVDKSREDPFAPAPHTPRELLAAAWYPAEVASNAKPEPFWPANAHMESMLRAPSFFFSHIHLVKSHSYLDAPVAPAERQYPVLIFSHGYSGSIWQNTAQMEELASHGFIVFSLGHTYESAAVPFPDGRVILMSQARWDEMMHSTLWAELVKLYQQQERTNDRAELRRIAMQIMAIDTGGLASKSLPVWVADTRYLMDELEKINSGEDVDIVGPAKQFAGRFDLARLGVLGMSFGGAIVSEVCARDPRCKAGLNLDGEQFGVPMDHSLQVPYLHFSNAHIKMDDSIYEDSRADSYGVHVNRSTHQNFTDMSLALPLAQWISSYKIPLLGRVDRKEMEDIMSAYTLAFFQQYLQGKPQPLLDGPPPAGKFPDVVFSAQKAPAAQSEPAAPARSR